MHFDAGLNSLFWAFFVHHFSINIFTSTQCDQIGQFFKVLGNKIASKRGQMIGNFLGYFEKPHSYAKTALGTFWATFGKNWATFNSNIWSHC